MEPPNFRQQRFGRRALLLGGLQLLAGAGLAGRMAWLSIAEKDRYQLASDSNRIALNLIPPRRGWIVDANGAPIASNRPAYAAELIPSLAGDLDEALDRLARYLPISAEDRQRLKREAAALPPSGSLSVGSDIGWDAYAALNLELADMDGLQPTRTFLRHYPDGEAFAHLVGYVGRPTAEQYREDHNPLYMVPGFRVGKDGVERSLDPVMRGKPGARRVEVNARGHIIRELDTSPDIPGQTVHLTIDRELQGFAARRIGRDSCSIVVLDIETGDVKCMLSMPAFDPDVFSNRIPAALWQQLRDDERVPLLNKTVQGLYVPGSTFKPVTALAALAEGVPPGDTVHCSGSYRVGNGVWHCWRRAGHGTLDMRGGIKNSCNVYFYTMGRRVGAEAIARTARTLGLEHSFDLPMPIQRTGIIPDPEWKERRFHQRWGVADTLNMAIGQGYVIINPLQLAVMVARVASGRVTEPRLLAGPPPGAFPSLGIPEENLAVIRAGMDDVVNGPGGTARASALPIASVHMAGKTGTAQVRRISAGFRGGLSVPWKYRDHGLFIGFAPADRPKYAISVVVEHGVGGAAAAAPIAREVMTWLFDRPEAERRLAILEEGWARRARATATAGRPDSGPAADAPPAGDPSAGDPPADDPDVPQPDDVA